VPGPTPEMTQTGCAITRSFGYYSS